MNPQDKQQVAARDDKWVPFSKRVNISSTNIRLETTVPQKEETFQVVIDLIKNSACFKAFTISADVPEYLCSNSDFTDVPNDDTALAFLIDLGYKGPLNILLPEYYCLSPTTATLSPLYHEPLIASVENVNVVNRSIRTNNPRPVPAGSVVPTGKDNSIVSTGSTKVIPAGRAILFLKEEYETWAMKMEYWIMNSDHNLWNIVLNGNSRKRTGRDPKGNIMILPPIFVEEHIVVQRETKARTFLLQSFPEDHMADFYHLDDARDIWLSVKTRFGGNEESKKIRKSMLKQEFSDFKVTESKGLHKGYDRFQKILSQLNQIQAKPDNEDCNMKFLRALPPSWSQVAITLKTKGGLDYLSFDDLYNKLKTLEIDVKGGSSYDSRGKVKCYKCSELGHFARECTGKQVDSKAKYSSFKLQELNKGEETKALLSVDSMEDATGEVADDVSNDAAEFALMGISSQVQTCPFGCEHLYAELKKEFDNVEAQYKECYIQVQAYKSTLQTLEQQKGWYQSNQLALEERIRILTANLENTTNMLKYTEKLNEKAKLDNLNDKVKLEESNARFDKWKESSKNLVKLINSSMSSRSRFGLGFGDTFGSDEVFDLSAPSIFDSSPKDVAEKPLHDRFVKTVGMHVVPPPLTGTFMPPSNNPDLDETQFTYGSKSNNNFETNSVSNDFVSCDNSDKSSDSETTDFASCVSSVKSSSSKTNEPLASTPSSVDFKTMTETADQQPSSTKDNPSFSFKENVKPPRNLCNKSGVNSRSLCNRKSFGSKTCFVCGSKFHLIKDCDFYEKQLELNNKPMWTNVANIPSFVPKAASVPAGSRNRQTSVPAGRPFSADWKNTTARPMTRPTSHYFQNFHRLFLENTKAKYAMGIQEQWWISSIYMDNPYKNKDLGIVDSGCSRSMTSNKEKLDDYLIQLFGGPHWDAQSLMWPSFDDKEFILVGLSVSSGGASVPTGSFTGSYWLTTSYWGSHLRQDLLKLYGMVVKYYEDHPLAGAGMMLWGDLQVLFESHEGGHGSLVWSDQQQWHIRSWRLFPFSNVHVLETISGKVVYMFADGSYPLLVQLMKKMLKHKLEIEINGVGNDMTYVE
ncbi:ribonuclease H-like domain-containing protein [Tanacetum coccineum]